MGFPVSTFYGFKCVPPQNSYVEAQISTVTTFGDSALKEINKLK